MRYREATTRHFYLGRTISHSARNPSWDLNILGAGKQWAKFYGAFAILPEARSDAVVTGSGRFCGRENLAFSPTIWNLQKTLDICTGIYPQALRGRYQSVRRFHEGRNKAVIQPKRPRTRTQTLRMTAVVSGIGFKMSVFTLVRN
jgi:hypothetical protein